MYFRLIGTPSLKAADGLAHEEADVAQLGVAGGVLACLPADYLLSCPFGHGDDGVVAGGQPVAQGGQECFQRERLFGDETEVDLAIGQRGVGGDEARFAPHQLDQADAVAGGDSLAVGAEAAAPRPPL
jgi:hypothetical protein